MNRALGVLVLSALIWLPGYATVTFLGTLARERRSLDDALEVLFLQIASGLAVGGLLALFAALVGFFNGFSWSGMVLLYSLVMLVLGKVRGAALVEMLPFRPRILKEHVALLVVLAIGFFLIISPFMTVFAERDDGVYSNIAAIIHNTGNVHYTDKLMRELKPEERPIFYRSDRPSQVTRVQETGFVVTDYSRGTIDPQFVYLYPAMLAVFMTFLGFKGGFFLLSVLAVLSALALYLIGSKLAGKYCGLLAAGLLSINIVQLYFGKWTGSEIATQFFFLSGMYCLIVYMKAAFDREDEPLWLWGITAGVLLACTMMSHIDMFLILGTFLLFTAFIYVDGGLKDMYRLRHFFITFILAGALATWLAFGVSGIYTNGVVSATLIAGVPGGWQSIGLMAASLVVAALLLRGPLHRFYLFLRRHRRVLLISVAVILVVLAIFDWFIRPRLYPAGDLHISALRARTFPVFAFYLTPLGAVLALSGYCLFLVRRLDKRSLLLVSTGLLFSMALLYKPFAAWLLIYAMRRFVPVVLPVAILMASYFLWEMGRLAKERLHGGLSLAGRTAIAAIAAGLIIWSLVLSLPVSRINEGSGSLALAHRIADLATGDSSVVVFDSAAGHVIASPTRYFFGKNVVKVRSKGLETKPEFSSFVKRQFAIRPVYLVSMGDNPNFGSLGFGLKYVGASSLQGWFLEQTITAPSTKTFHWNMEAFNVYRVVSVP